MYLSIWQSFVMKTMKDNRNRLYNFSIGMYTPYHSEPHGDRRMPAIRTKNYLRYSNFHQIRRNKDINQVFTNFWCRDQNFRKYFRMRKKNGQEPSLTEFKHLSMWTEQADAYDNMHKMI
jgi:hypothetical protein